MASTVWVNKNALTEIEIHKAPMPELAGNAVRLRIESFSVTANNITYAVVGDMFGYWNFFPAAGDMGVVPMWGHAEVEQTNCADFAVGERIYGYLPMGTHLDVIPGKITASGFADMSAHRQPMSPIYNQYNRLAADLEHDPAKESERMLFAPLFKTGFLIETMFRAEGWFGAQNLIMTSASSKTAMSLASVAKDLSPGIKRVGLTSRGNVDFVRGTGLYDDVVAYGDEETLPQVPSVAVDFAGSAIVGRAVHSRLADTLRYSCSVGMTHFGGRGSATDAPLPGPKPVLFFAPDYAVAAVKEMGPKAFGEAVAKSWKCFLGAVDGTIKPDIRSGLEAAALAFKQTLQGKADPAIGIIIKP